MLSTLQNLPSISLIKRLRERVTSYSFDQPILPKEFRLVRDLNCQDLSIVVSTYRFVELNLQTLSQLPGPGTLLILQRFPLVSRYLDHQNPFEWFLLLMFLRRKCNLSLSFLQSLRLLRISLLPSMVQNWLLFWLLQLKLSFCFYFISSKFMISASFFSLFFIPKEILVCFSRLVGSLFFETSAYIQLLSSFSQFLSLLVSLKRGSKL